MPDLFEGFLIVGICLSLAFIVLSFIWEAVKKPRGISSLLVQVISGSGVGAFALGMALLYFHIPEEQMTARMSCIIGAFLAGFILFDALFQAVCLTTEIRKSKED